MRNALIALSLTAGLAAADAALAVTPVRPQAVCPQIRRQPVDRYADLPRAVRARLGAMAERNGRWNAGDALGPGDERYPFQHYLAGGHLGGDRWVVIYEKGGFAHFWTVAAFRLAPAPGGGRTAVEIAAASGAPLERVCVDAAARLRRP
ncbi:MAG: hypothetical protein K1X35_01265 [Caulobacteraceae bacterium]|nr:hypothetical protein [Caulobacteraceae bacterium]